MLGPLTYLDAALLALVLISGLLAMYRGLTREVLSILSWVAAAGAVLYVVLNHKKEAEELAKQFGAPTPVGQVAIGGVVFLIVLIIVHLITARVSDSILDSRVGMIDRILGFAFGAVRGFVLLVIPYMFYETFVPNPQQQYVWVREAKSQPYLKRTGQVFYGVLSQFKPPEKLVPESERPRQG